MLFKHVEDVMFSLNFLICASLQQDWSRDFCSGVYWEYLPSKIVESWLNSSNLGWTSHHVQSFKCQELEHAGCFCDKICIYLWIEGSFGVC